MPPRAVASADELWERAVELLARRAHARGELTRKLRRYQPSAEMLAAVLARLEERGLLDDERFARDRAESLTRGGKAGPARVSAQLRAHGVGATEVQSAVAGLEVDWEEACRATAAERMRRGIDLRDPKARARLLRYLASRGFPHGLCSRVVSELSSAGEDALEASEDD